MVTSPTVKLSCHAVTVASPPPDRAKTVSMDRRVSFRPDRCFMFGCRVRGPPLNQRFVLTIGGLWVGVVFL